MQGWSFILVLCKSPRPQRSFCSHLKGEPYWPASVSSPPRWSPHVTSSSRPATGGRWAGWWGTPPEQIAFLTFISTWFLVLNDSLTLAFRRIVPSSFLGDCKFIHRVHFSVLRSSIQSVVLKKVSRTRGQWKIQFTWIWPHFSELFKDVMTVFFLLNSV